jgi:hypothetical protein
MQLSIISLTFQTFAQLFLFSVVLVYVHVYIFVAFLHFLFFIGGYETDNSNNNTHILPPETMKLTTCC